MTPSQPSPKPHGVSLWFGSALVCGLMLGLVVFVLATHGQRTGAPTPPSLRDARGDESWVEKYHPTPLAESTPIPYLTPRPVPTPLPLTPYQRPYTRPAPDQAARERLERYQRALAADVMVKVDDGQVRETPRLVSLDATAPASSPIAVSARPAPPHTITAWTFIYGTLETGIQSDHPGDVLGRVSQDVKDSVTQTEILIPMGSKLHGHQPGREQVQPNDTSLLVAWDDIEFPNGGHVRLPEMPSTDAEGYPGFEDLVNNQYARTWAPAVLISAITAGTMLASHPTYGGINGYNPEQQALGAAGESLGSRAVGQLGSSLNQNKPTITIEPGYHYRVLVTRDLTFSGPYGVQ